MMSEQEIPVAHSLMRLLGETEGSQYGPMERFVILWMAFNNIYTVISDRTGLRAEWKQKKDGSMPTNDVHGIEMPSVTLPQERDQLVRVFEHFGAHLRHRLVAHPSTGYFVERTPRWRGHDIETDNSGHRVNGVINVGRTLSEGEPVWAPIDTDLYKRYMVDEEDEEARDTLATQVRDVLYTIRNNTFHGNRRGDDADDMVLMEHAVNLLHTIVENFTR